MQTMTTAIAMAPQDPMRGTGFFEETPGNSSSMRLMCMMSLVTAITLSAFVIATPPPPYKTTDAKGQTSLVYPPRDPQGFYLIYGFLIAAFAPKAIQKFAEQKIAAYNPSQPLPPPYTVPLQQVIAPAALQQPSELVWQAPLNGQQPIPMAAIQANGAGIAQPPALMAQNPAAPATASRIESLKNRGGL